MSGFTLQSVATWDETHVAGIPPEAGLQASPSLYEVAAPSCVGEKANVPLPHPSLLAHVAPKLSWCREPQPNYIG